MRPDIVVILLFNIVHYSTVVPDPNHVCDKVGGAAQ